MKYIVTMYAMNIEATSKEDAARQALLMIGDQEAVGLYLERPHIESTVSVELESGTESETIDVRGYVENFS